MVDDLHALLRAAAIPPPYVPVGHSVGGLLMRLYAASYPEKVAGLVPAIQTSGAGSPSVVAGVSLNHDGGFGLPRSRSARSGRPGCGQTFEPGVGPTSHRTCDADSHPSWPRPLRRSG